MGGDRRVAGLHALPARRHLQLRSRRVRPRAHRADLQREGRGARGARPVRLGRRRRRTDARDARAGRPQARPRRLAAGRAVRSAHLLRRGGGRADRSAGLGRRDVPRAAPRHARLAAEDEARQPAQRGAAAAGGAVGGDRERSCAARRTRRSELRDAWRTVLLQQFHDILPGTSIAWVHQDAEAGYARVAESLGAVIDTRARRTRRRRRHRRSRRTPARSRSTACRRWASGRRPLREPAAPRADGDGFVLEDAALRVVIDGRGVLVSVRDLVADREVLPEGHGRRRAAAAARHPARVGRLGHQRGGPALGTRAARPGRRSSSTATRCAVRHEFGASSVELRIRLVDGRIDCAFDIDWHESQKLLKLAFPLDVRADRATSEIQFGHLHRPIHRNTSWDSARFETVAHRWIQVGEPSWGVAIANDVVYGHDIRTLTAPSGRPMAMARLSLLRAPLYPDPGADQGVHAFTVSLRPGGIPEAIDDGYRQSLPPRPTRGTPVAPLLDGVGPGGRRGGGQARRGRQRRPRRAALRGARRSLVGDARRRRSTGTRSRRPTCWSASIAGTAIRSTAPRRIELELRPFELLTLRLRAPRAAA